MAWIAQERLRIKPYFYSDPYRKAQGKKYKK